MRPPTPGLGTKPGGRGAPGRGAPGAEGPKPGRPPPGRGAPGGNGGRGPPGLLPGGPDGRCEGPRFWEKRLSSGALLPTGLPPTLPAAAAGRWVKGNVAAWPVGGGVGFGGGGAAGFSRSLDCVSAGGVSLGTGASSFTGAAWLPGETTIFGCNFFAGAAGGGAAAGPSVFAAGPAPGPAPGPSLFFTTITLRRSPDSGGPFAPALPVGVCLISSAFGFWVLSVSSAI